MKVSDELRKELKFHQGVYQKYVTLDIDDRITKYQGLFQNLQRKINFSNPLLRS